jgi:hypothetical protein
MKYLPKKPNNYRNKKINKASGKLTSYKYNKKKKKNS